MQAIRVRQTGGPEVLELQEIPTPTPAEGELLVKLEAAGLNFIDTYQRSGLYSMETPYTPGLEGAGRVAQVGSGVTGLQEGDTVAYTGVLGAYAEYAVIPAERAVAVPSGMDTKTAAAIMLQGMTAHYLCRDTYRVEDGTRCLIHAGAGGVGLLLIQMCKMHGAEVFTTVSTEEKAQLASTAGADHVIRYTEQDFEEAVRQIGGERPLDVVYDSVGRTTFEKGLHLLRPRGLMVLYGQSSGPLGPMDLQLLAANGSLFTTRPTLMHYIAERRELDARASDIMAWVQAGTLSVRIGTEYPLDQAREAHQALEGRKTTGKVLLVP
jgi:NADPH2:quinone reductase